MLNNLKNLAAAALVALPLGMLLMGAPDAKTEREALTMLTIGDRDLAPWPVPLAAAKEVHFTHIDAEMPHYDLSPPPLAGEGFAGIYATPEALALSSKKWPEAAPGDMDPISPGALLFGLAAATGLGLLFERRPRRLGLAPIRTA